LGRPCLWDAAWLFADLGIDVAALTFADDLDPLLLESDGRLSELILVGRCRLTISKPVLKAPMFSALEAIT
jgi:hypothetical protein